MRTIAVIKKSFSLGRTGTDKGRFQRDGGRGSTNTACTNQTGEKA
jgi:hypothetical protein